MRFKFPRRLVPATLAVAILIAPLPASAAPRPFGVFSMFESSWGSIVGWTGNLLRHLWAEEGASCDPLGRPACASAVIPEDGRHLWAEEGISIDPLGLAAPAPAATAEGGRQ